MTKIYNGTRYYKYKVRSYIKSSLFRSSILYFGHDFCVQDKCVTLGGATGNPNLPESFLGFQQINRYIFIIINGKCMAYMLNKYMLQHPGPAKNMCSLTVARNSSSLNFKKKKLSRRILFVVKYCKIIRALITISLRSFFCQLKPFSV